MVLYKFLPKGFLNLWTDESLSILSVLRSLLLFYWLVFSNFNTMVLVLTFHFILFCFILFSGSLLFQMRDEREWILMGEELREEVGGMEERKTVLILYCMWKECMFNKRKINLKLLLRIKQNNNTYFLFCHTRLSNRLLHFLQVLSWYQF